MTNIDYLRVERALSGVMPLVELNPEERGFCQKYKFVFEIGRMAERRAQGYYAHVAGVEVARDPRSKELISTIPDGQPVPVGYVIRGDGSKHVFNFHYYLDYLNSPAMVDDLARTWLESSLLNVGDALDDKGYFKHQVPLLELLRHLRNGIAHGNKFDFGKGKQRQKRLERLKQQPAHNKKAQMKTAEFQIEESLEGQPVLFHFMKPGDILDLLQSVGIYLTRVRERIKAGELDSHGNLL
jgi:hypothetical protein